MDDVAELAGRWLTSKEAAALLRVHPKHIYRLLRRGLPAQRVGGQWRFRASAIECWAQGDRPEVTKGDKDPQPVCAQEPASALLLSRDDVAVLSLVAEINRRAPPALGLVLPDDASLPWFEQPRILATALLGDEPLGAPVQLAWLHIAHEVFGLIGPAAGPPPELSRMLRRNARTASWPVDSDLRCAIDAVLARDGFDPDAAHARATLFASHCDVVAAVARGDARVGVTTAAWALRFGLPFRPLGSRPLGLVVPAASLGHPVLIRCWEVLQSVPFRTSLERAGGYDTSQAGALRYLRPQLPLALLPTDRSAPVSRANTPPAPGASVGRSRWVIVVRDRGQDVSDALLRLAARLREERIAIGGFVQVPRRVRSHIVGYDLQRVGARTRLPLARRQASPSVAGPAYQSFRFDQEVFVKARGWLARDMVRARVLMLDGVSTRETDGGGHFHSLAWVAALPAPVLVIATVRRDRVATMVDKLGLAGRLHAVLEAPSDAAGWGDLEASIVVAARG